MSTPMLAKKLATSKSAKLKNGYYPVVLQVTFQTVPRRIRLGMKANTRKFYRDSVVSMKKLRPQLDIKELTPALLLEHEEKYYSAAYMGGLRAVVNYGIMKGYLKAEYNPFRTSHNPTGYSFSHIKQKKKPVALTESEIELFKSLEDDSLYHDMAMFSYYTFPLKIETSKRYSNHRDIKTGLPIILIKFSSSHS